MRIGILKRVVEKAINSPYIYKRRPQRPYSKEHAEIVPITLVGQGSVHALNLTLPTIAHILKL